MNNLTYILNAAKLRYRVATMPSIVAKHLPKRSAMYRMWCRAHGVSVCMCKAKGE